jgi:protein gp37
MGATTKIEWTDHTFNPWIGCTKVSEGCRNCYAARDNERWKWNGGAWGPGALRKVTSVENWREPLKWAKAARAAGKREKVFCASLADVFDAEAPRLARADLWPLVGDTSDALDWQFLTKRPERIAEVMAEDKMPETFFLDARCWLGTTVEDQDAARRRIAPFVQVLARYHFLSCEPLIGALDLLEPRSKCTCTTHDDIDDDCPGELQLIDGINWVICGGESGPGARQTKSEWVRELQDQCAAADVPFFFKQWGDWYRQTYGADCAWHPDGWDPGAVKGGSLLRCVEYKAFPAAR